MYVVSDNGYSSPNRSTGATTWLILICLLLYIPGFQYQRLLSFTYNNLVYRHQWWTLFTALFVHGSLGHLLGNLLFLFLFGRSLERIIGSSRLLLVFFAGGALSLLASHLFYDADVPVVGASGSICAILGLLMIYSPWKISFLLNFFPMPLGVAALTYMVMNYLLSRTSNNAVGSRTAYELHIAGCIQVDH